MSRFVFPTFPCVICGIRFDTEEEYIRYCDEERKKHPGLTEGIMKCMAEELQYLDLPKVPRFRLKWELSHEGTVPGEDHDAG